MDDSEVPRGAILDAWSALEWKNGIQTEKLEDMDQLTVYTENSVYEFTIISPWTAEVLVRGGKFFPELTKAILLGSSLGGSFLKLHGVYVGFKMEINCEPCTIITSPVRKFVVTPNRS